MQIQNIQKKIIQKKQAMFIQKEVQRIYREWIKFEYLWQVNNGNRATPPSIFMEWYSKNYYELLETFPPNDTSTHSITLWLKREICSNLTSKQL